MYISKYSFTYLLLSVTLYVRSDLMNRMMNLFVMNRYECKSIYLVQHNAHLYYSCSVCAQHIQTDSKIGVAQIIFHGSAVLDLKAIHYWNKHSVACIEKCIFWYKNNIRRLHNKYCILNNYYYASP